MPDAPLITTAALVRTLDLIGTFVFAISGAASGVKGRLDVFGLIVLAFVAGTAGGMTRDVLIGAVPPAAISNWRYAGASVIASADGPSQPDPPVPAELVMQFPLARTVVADAGREPDCRCAVLHAL